MTICGYRSGVFHDPSRPNWQNSGLRPIFWSAWYPARQIAATEPPAPGFFELGDITFNAPIEASNGLPVVLMSHGTGGTAESLGWLARSLAMAGYVVIAVNHHGNTGLESYAAGGFLCWWERAADLSFLLSHMAQDEFFSESLDLDQVFAVGFSLGGYTVMALAGAQTSMAEFERWRTDNEITDAGPREFPDAGSHVSSLMESSPAFRSSWSRSADDLTDIRVKRIVAIAPAPAVRSFTRSSLTKLTAPFLILSGGNDIEAPSVHCADWLVRQNNRFEHFDLGHEVGHYTFLGFPSDKTLIGRGPLFNDHVTVDREAVHNRSTLRILEHLS